MNSCNGRCNLCINEKISIINFKDRKLLLNECNELLFKCKHKSKFKFWFGATEAPTLDKKKDIDFGWFLLGIITSISVITSIIWWWGIYVGKEILGTLDINLKLIFFLIFWSS